MTPMHSIEYTREALQVLAKMPRNVREVVTGKIEGGWWCVC